MISLKRSYEMTEPFVTFFFCHVATIFYKNSYFLARARELTNPFDRSLTRAIIDRRCAVHGFVHGTDHAPAADHPP